EPKAARSSACADADSPPATTATATSLSSQGLLCRQKSATRRRNCGNSSSANRNSIQEACSSGRESAQILRRAEAVETTGIIRPLGIAEIGRAAGESVGSHRRPGGIDQIRAGLHHNDQVAGPGDGEPELIRLYAEVLRLRIPQ